MKAAWLFGAAIAGIVTATPAYAQQSQDESESVPADAANPEEIVVTAGKRVERLQDVPAPVQAITSDALATLNAASVDDVFSQMAGVNAKAGSRGTASFNIRGIESLAASSITASTVGYYLDETPLTDAAGSPAVAVFDAERIEVLRGPQGTLYGEGALGGAVRIIMNKPDVEQFSARVLGQLEAFKGGDLGGQAAVMFNAPLLSDKLALRVVGNYVREGGYLDNVGTGKKNENSSDTGSFRTVLRATPVGGLNIDLSYLRQNFKAHGRDEINLAVGKNAYENAFTARLEDRSDLFNLTVNWDGPAFSVVSSSSYFDRRRQEVFDARVFYPVAEALFGVPPANGLFEESETNERTFTQELRVASPDSHRLRWLIGGWYKHRKIGFDLSERLPEAAPFLPPLGILFDRDVDQRFEEIALFGELSYKLTERLTLTGGTRLFDNRLVGERVGAQFGAPFLPSSARIKSSDVLFKASADYKFDRNLMVYALFSQGVRGGGLNILGSGIAPALGYGSDSTDNFEAGFKGSLFDRTLTLNASLYLIHWKDIQTTIADTPGNGYTTNGGRATSKGLEIEATLNPAAGLKLGTVLTFAKAETDERFDLQGYLTEDLADDIYAEKGEILPYFSKFRSNVYADYGFLIGKLDANLRLDWAHVSSRPNSLRTTGGATEDLFIRFAAYDTVDVRFSVGDGAWRANLYVENLLNERAAVDGFYPDIMGLTYNSPRSVGIGLRYEF